MKHFIIILFAGLLSAQAQEKGNPELFLTLKKADSVLFEACFNRCDFAVLDKIVHPELQFIHDVAGMQDKKVFTEAVRNNICSKTGPKPIRKLVDGSLEVYPLYKDGKLYGAVQMGKHEFYLSEAGKPLKKTGIAKFTHTWLLENGQWKLYHVISYDHKPADDQK